jgi:hypothetical protein
MSKFIAGDRVRIVSLTDIDYGDVYTTNEAAAAAATDYVDIALIGKTGTIVEPYLNDYYDCTVRMDGEMPRGYEVLGMVEDDLELVRV